MCRLMPHWLIALALLSAPTSPVSAQAPAEQAASAQARVAWLYKVNGKVAWFEKDAGKKWAETTIEGSQFHFEELARTPDFVEIFDKSRTMWLRLHAGHCEWRQGKKNEWFRLYDGRWVSASELPKPPPADYRIRLAYFVPTDRKPTADYAAKVRVVMQVVAEVYRQDFTARGISSKGLRFQTDKAGQPLVHLIRGARPAAFYNKAPNYDGYHQWKPIIDEVPPEVGVPTRNVIVIFTETYDDGPAKFEWPGGVALGQRFSTEGGVGLFSAWILRPELCATTFEQQKKWLFDETPIKGRIALGHGQMNSPRFEFIEDGFGAVAHELGHALGLPHDHRQGDIHIMSNGFRNLRWNFTTPPNPAKRARFSDDNARILYTSRYLAPAAVLADRTPSTVELSWAAPLKAGATTIAVAVTAADNEGLRASLFFSPAEDSVVGGRALSGKSQVFQQTLTVRPLQPGPFRLLVTIADAGGNLTEGEIAGEVK